MGTSNTNEIFESFNNFIKSIDNNKNILILIVILLGVYFAFYADNVATHTINLFDNEIFKFALFILITWISSSSPVLGISLALIMFASLQIITYIKLKKDLDDDIDKIENCIQEDKENFTSIESFESIKPVDMSYLSNEHLTNPFKKNNQLAPPVNFNLKYTTPKDLSYQMINAGKNLLNDTCDLEQDLITRYDTREKKIIFETKIDSNNLIKSGLNRLQKSNQGEYNNNEINGLNGLNGLNKLIDFQDHLINSNLLIKSMYDELMYNYKLLINGELKSAEFDAQLNKTYLSEFKLLEAIYKLNESKYFNSRQKTINDLINKMKNSSDEKINYPYILNKLYTNIFE